ncbi:MAG: (d)CMP kinase [Thermotogae bacterium]|nr:(d)CMP kinase [Thermotogota bacterium]
MAIDGPSGVGKTTVARLVADRLGLKAVSTGALYRAVALYLIQTGVNPNNPLALRVALQNVELDQKYEDGRIRTFLNGEDVTDHLDTVEVSDMASRVAAIPEVREFLLDVQRRLAEGGAVVEGRDIGTVVLPEAQVKVFLDASTGERARRRYEQLRAEGINISYEEALKDVKERDIRDSSREVAPLQRARDAVYIDTTHMSAEEVANRILKLVREIVP